MRTPSLYSYIVAHDTGFSPNPFWGYCSLACCKPVIRRTAKVGDWIVGLSPKAIGNKIIYVMKVGEKVTFTQYFTDPRFKKKIPDFESESIKRKSGDNIYQPIGENIFKQMWSVHSEKDGTENETNKKHDLAGEFVLIANEYWYYGREALSLPTDFQSLIVGRGHRRNTDPIFINAFINFITDEPIGVKAPPTKWKDQDNSWKHKLCV